MDTASKRVSKQPNRYGDPIVNLTNETDDTELFDDNSFEDKNYSPEEESIVGQGDTSNSSEHSNESDHSNKSPNLIDFEKDFQELARCSSSQSENLCEEESSIVGTENAAQSNSRPHNSNSQISTSFELAVLDQLKRLNDNSEEIKVRFAVLEEVLMKNGMMAKVDVFKNKSDQQDEFNSFVKSNDMPFKTVRAFKAFEDSLDDESTKNAVSHYSTNPHKI